MGLLDSISGRLPIIGHGFGPGGKGRFCGLLFSLLFRKNNLIITQKRVIARKIKEVKSLNEGGETLREWKARVTVETMVFECLCFGLRNCFSMGWLYNARWFHVRRKVKSKCM